MKRTIYDCWNCRHHNSNNPYGIDRCEVHDTRCSFACDNCEDYEPEKREDYHEQQQPGIMRLIGCYLMFVIATLLVWLLTGCTTTKYVPVVEHRTDTTYIARQERDSIYVHDSIHVRETGDTVRIERWHTRWRDRWRYDTIYIASHDTVPRPYSVEVEVPARLTWWQHIRVALGDVVLWVLGLWVVGWIWKKHRH